MAVLNVVLRNKRKNRNKKKMFSDTLLLIVYTWFTRLRHDKKVFSAFKPAKTKYESHLYPDGVKQCVD